MSCKKTPQGPLVIALVLGLLVGVSFSVIPGIAESGDGGGIYESREGERGDGRGDKNGPNDNEADPDWFVTDVWGGVESTKRAPQVPRMYVFGPYGGVLNWLFGHFGSVFSGFGR